MLLPQKIAFGLTVTLACATAWSAPRKKSPAPAKPAASESAAPSDESGAGAENAPAGPRLDIQAAVSEALAGSPKIQKARAANEEVSWKRVEAYQAFLPTLGGSASYLLAKKYALTDFTLPGSPAPLSIPQIIPTTDLMVSASMPIFDGLAAVDQWRAAKTFEAASNAETDWAVFQVERDVELQFYRALAAQELQHVAEENLSTIDDHLKETNLFKRAGVSTNYDVLRVEVQMSEAKSEVLNSLDSVSIARARLAEAIGKESEERPLGGKLPVLKPDAIAGLGKPGAEGTQGVPQRKDLEALSLQGDAYNLRESAAGRYWFPRFSLFGQYQYYNNINDSIHDGAAFRDAYQVGIAMNVNLFDGLTSVARSKESVQQRVQAEKTLEMARNHARVDQDVWRRRFVYNCSVYQARLDDIEKSEESVRLAREGRKAGIRTNTDILDAELELFRARAGAVNAQIGAIESLINFELATGQRIASF